jgi:hypothetical protein
MRTSGAQAAVLILLLLVALTPLRPARGLPASLPSVCEALAFSTEEDFVTTGPEPPDGNPVISDGDLLTVYTDHTGAVRCLICARNADLLANTFDVGVDLGLDAVDVIDADAYLVAFSTELDSSNVGQFTAGDLLVTNGAIIPNQALTSLWQVGYDLGLDAVHFVGDRQAVRAFLAEAQQIGRDDWLRNAGLLVDTLEKFDVDILFSTEGTLGPVTSPTFLDGDLLSARNGTIVAGNADLLPPSAPAGLPADGVDFGLDAATTNRQGKVDQIHFSTEILYDGNPSLTDGDVLRYGSGPVRTNKDLVQCFAPRADFLGLDALHQKFGEDEYHDVFLPVIFRNSQGR